MEFALMAHLRKQLGDRPRNATATSPEKVYRPNSDQLGRKGDPAELHRQLWQHGRLTLAYTLKAYFPIYCPGEYDHLGMVLFADTDDVALILSELPELATKLRAFRFQPDPAWNEEERLFMEAVDDDLSHSGGREVPRGFSPRLKCYIADFKYPRAWMPASCLRIGWVPVLAAPDPFPRACLIHSRHWTPGFTLEWQEAVAQEVRKVTAAKQRLQAAAQEQRRREQGPAPVPNLLLTADHLRGWWLHWSEQLLEEEDALICSMQITARLEFQAGGKVTIENESRLEVNGEYYSPVPPRIENHEGTYQFLEGCVSMSAQGSTFSAVLVNAHELAISKTERYYGPYARREDIPDQRPSIPPPLPEPPPLPGTAWRTAPPPLVNPSPARGPTAIPAFVFAISSYLGWGVFLIVRNEKVAVVACLFMVATTALNLVFADRASGRMRQSPGPYPGKNLARVSLALGIVSTIAMVFGILYVVAVMVFRP